MKGTNLGEFEELVLRMVGILFDDAYGVAIKDEILSRASRKATLSSVHAVLNRLEKKGYLQSRMGAPTKVRGGKRKRYFKVTPLGKKALEQVMQTRKQLWDGAATEAAGRNPWQQLFQKNGLTD